MLVLHLLSTRLCILTFFEKHKLGADRVEKILAVPSNPQDRLKDAGPEREIEARAQFKAVFKLYIDIMK